MSVGRTTLVLSTETHAQVIKAWLDAQTRNAVSFRDLAGLRIPEAASGCQALLHALQRDKERLTQMQQEIARSEEKVNQLALDIYGLGTDRDARGIIDDFLSRF